MNPTTTVRLIGGAVILLNLWLIGRYSISGVPVLLMTFGVAAGFEVVARAIGRK